MKKLFIKNKQGEKLAGIKGPAPFLQPFNDEGIQSKYPTVILVHGFGVTKEEGGMFDELAERLTNSNFLVYRFDFSGCGESEGDYDDVSLTKLKDDLDAILKYVKSQPEVDNSRIGILAQSFGTSTTVALEPDVKTIILMGSVSHCGEIFKEHFGDSYNPDGISERTKSSGRVIQVKPIFWESFKKFNLLESIQNIHCPILFLHGSEDTKVPISEMEAYFNVANDPKEKIIIPDADHGLRPKRKEMYQIANDWFKEHL